MLKHGSKLVDTIFVHCTATQPEWMEGQPLSAKVKEIDAWHKKRGFNRIGYQYVIDRNGEIAKGRAETEVGAHVANYNTGSIGISLVGGFGSNENDPFEKNFTSQQNIALRNLIDDIKTRAKITKIRGHNEVSAKACPGFSVKRWLANKSPQRPLSESTTMQAGAVQLVSGAGAGATVISQFDGTAQIVAIVFVALALLATVWIMRERIKKWVRETHE